MTTPQPPPYGTPQPPPYGTAQLPAGPPPGTASSSLAMLVSASAGLVLTPVLILLAMGMSGHAFLRLQRLDMGLSTVIPIILFGVGSLIVAFLLAVSIRFSSAGAYVGAGILLAIGALSLLAPMVLFDLSMSLDGMFRGGEVFLLSGMPLVLAGLLAGAGVAASMIRRRQRSTPVSRS